MWRRKQAAPAPVVAVTYENSRTGEQRGPWYLYVGEDLNLDVITTVGDEQGDTVRVRVVAVGEAEHR